MAQSLVGLHKLQRCWVSLTPMVRYITYALGRKPGSGATLGDDIPWGRMHPLTRVWGQVFALRAHCVRTACILRTQRPGYSPKNTCHLTGCTAKQRGPHENNQTAFKLVLHCPYEQTTQPCKVRLLRMFRCPWLRSWRRR